MTKNLRILERAYHFRLGPDGTRSSMVRLQAALKPFKFKITRAATACVHARVYACAAAVSPFGKEPSGSDDFLGQVKKPTCHEMTKGVAKWRKKLKPNQSGRKVSLNDGNCL